MKKVVLITAAIILLIALILLIPIPKGSYDDGGTREYEAVLYKIVHWNRLTDRGVYEKTCLYFGADKRLSPDELFKREVMDHSATNGPPVTVDVQYIRTDGYHEELSYPAVKLIRSVEELSAYYEANKELYDLERRASPAADSTLGFLDACDRYDDAFFKEHRLILILLEESSGSNRHRVTAVRQNADGKLTVDIENIIPETGTCDMALWHIFAETDADIADEHDISLSFRTADKAVTYTADFANITLPIPDGWDYTLTDKGIRFWPSEHADGKLHAYFSGGFGVCGTGLTCEDILLGGYEAEQGTYDGKDVWDYIFLKNTVGDYVIINEGADAWWDEYGDEAMTILERITVGEGLLPEEKAIHFAKDVCVVDYTDIRTWFDSQNGTWDITFYTEDALGGGQTVTLDAVTGAVLNTVGSE